MIAKNDSCAYVLPLHVLDVHFVLRKADVEGP
jgi:hypothetical protein